LIGAFLLAQRERASSQQELAAMTKQSAATAPSVVVIPAEAAPATLSLALPGETAAWYESTIYARVSGYVGKWFVDIGDSVKKGQVLATIDTPDLDAELAGAQAKLKAADADVKVRQAQAEFARSTYERWRDSPKGVVSDQEREAKKADYASGVALENAAKAQVNADQGEVDRLMALTQFKQVTAPYDGVIIERRIDIGNLVTAGSTSSTTLLYRMSQNNPMRIFVDVPQRAAADISVGLAVTFTANDMPNRVFHGTVARTAQSINPQARTLRVEVDLPNPDNALVPGMYIDANFELKARGTVEVPPAAISFRAKGPQVAIVGPDDKIRFHDVAIARDDGNVVEIGSGLAPGDKVVLNINNQIAEGTKVNVSGQTEGLASAAPAPVP